MISLHPLSASKARKKNPISNALDAFMGNAPGII
jgi:hypothetical protein